MDKNTIIHITTRHYNKLKRYSKKIVPGLDHEAIHQFRVTFKELRAFFRMLSCEDPVTEQIKMPKKLKAVYGITGAIRDLQLQQQNILEVTRQKNKKPAAYLNLLQKEIDKLKPELFELLTKNPVAKSKKKTKSALPHEFPPAHFNSFIQKKGAVTGALINLGHFSNTNIHTIRKNLKDLFYCIKICKTVKPGILQQYHLQKKETIYLEDFLKELGAFQDKCTAIALLKSYWLKRLNTATRLQLEQVKKQWIAERNQLKKPLVKKLKESISLFSIADVL